MHPDRIVAFADDLTGALEVGAKFAIAGISARVEMPPTASLQSLRNETGVLVIDTETRHSAPAIAAKSLSKYALAAREAGFNRAYKKTDSTLRGNIGAELAALIESFGETRLLYTPAYPQMGRTVNGGTLLVNGTPVSDSSFASDAFNPVRESHIPTMLTSKCDLDIYSGTVASFRNFDFTGVAVCDGSCESDLEDAAKLFVESKIISLAAGPAGFATHLARFANMPREPRVGLPRISTALIVNGSLHPASEEQIGRALATPELFTPIQPGRTTLQRGEWGILQPISRLDKASLEFSFELAQATRDQLAAAPVDALVIFGGDTAYAIVSALGNPTLEMVGEVLESAPISRIAAGSLRAHLPGRQNDLFVISKAGGFGSPDVLIQVRNLLQKGSVE
jgi:uncharacterized protein YgbK (DUF1537 family)